MRQQANKKPETSRHKKNLRSLFLQFHSKRKIKKMQAIISEAPPNVQRAFLSAYSTWLKNGGVTRDH